MKFIAASSFFPPAWETGGLAVAAYELAQALLRAGHDVTVLTTNAGIARGQNIPHGQPTVFTGVPVQYCRRLMEPFSYAPALRAALRARMPQAGAVIARGIWTYVNFAVHAECRRAGAPYLAYVDGCLDPWALRHHGWRKKLYWPIERGHLNHAAAVLALTAAEADQIRAAGVTARIEIIPNGVSIPEPELAASRKSIEQRFPPLAGRPWLLFLGRLHEKKGLPLLLEAFQRVAESDHDVALIIAGSGEGAYSREIRQRAAAHPLAARIVLTGHVSGELKWGLLHCAAVFVLPSFSEGLPIACLEALGCGVPVVASAHCHLPELAAAEAGLLTELDAPVLANLLLSLLRDERLRARMGERGRKLIQEKFAWPRVAAQIAALAANLI